MVKEIVLVSPFSSLHEMAMWRKYLIFLDNAMKEFEAAKDMILK